MTKPRAGFTGSWLNCQLMAMLGPAAWAGGSVHRSTSARATKRRIGILSSVCTVAAVGPAVGWPAVGARAWRHGPGRRSTAHDILLLRTMPQRGPDQDRHRDQERGHGGPEGVAGVDLLPLIRGGEIETPNRSESYHGDPRPAAHPRS